MTKRMTPAAADYIWTLSEQIYDAEAEYIVAKAKDSPRQRILLERLEHLRRTHPKVGSGKGDQHTVRRRMPWISHPVT